MVNLYARLGISPEATASQIAEACQACTNRQLRDSCVHILLNEKRREGYDKMFRQLSRIGQLRANLGLTFSEHWQAGFNDFTKEPTIQGSLLDRMKRRYGSRRNAFWTKNWKLFAGMAWLTFFSILVGVVAAKLDNTTPVVFEQPLQRIPLSGMLSRPQPLADSSLLIKASSQYSNCYIRIIETSTNKLFDVAFLRPGETVEGTLPAGTYQLHIASGPDWYGETHLFGPTTDFRQLTDSIMLNPDKPAIVNLNLTTKLDPLERPSF